jgi:hypothetical protein
MTKNNLNLYYPGGEKVGFNIYYGIAAFIAQPGAGGTARVYQPYSIRQFQVMVVGVTENYRIGI